MIIASFPFLYKLVERCDGKRKSESPISLDDFIVKPSIECVGMCSMPLFLKCTNSKVEKLFPFDPDNESAMMVVPTAAIITLWGYYKFSLYLT